MDVSIKYISLCFLSLCLCACNDSQQAESITSAAESTATAEALLLESQIQAETSVKNFYQAVAENNCDKALLVRPEYSVSKCENINETVISSIRTEFIDETRAAIYLNLSYLKNNKRKHFNGFLWLKNETNKWEIQEDFESIDSMGADDFIATYISSDANADEVNTIDIIDNNHDQVLSRLRGKFSSYSREKVILIDVSEQTMSFYDKNNTLIDYYPVSTATKGFGNLAGSDKTPLGAHRISNRFGDNAKLGTIFKARQNTGKLAKILTEAIDVEEDHVTTRVLWLDGLEAGKNKGGNVDSHSRFIYIHGTPEEGLIGKPASHGCIRMINKDVINVFEQSVGDTLVYIGK